MKRNNLHIIYLFVLIFGILLIPSVFAQHGNRDSIISQSEINSNLKKEMDTRQKKNYLSDNALDYFKAYARIVFDGNKNTYMDMDHPSFHSEESIISFMEYRADNITLNNIGVPTLTDQFDIMTYLIYKNRNDDLKYFLNEGWVGSIEIEVNLPNGETKNINLFTQAILSNNKEALQIIRDSISKKDLVTAYQIALVGLIAETDYNYDNEYLKSRYIYAENNLTADSIAQTIIEGDIITLYDYVDIIQNKSQNAELLFDAFNLLIDYRIEQDY